MNTNELRAAWNAIAAHYQQHTAAERPLVHYGPWAPTESELGILGDVADLDILELGCGGGQCSIAFAQQGARVTGLDLSERQLAFAQALAEAEGVKATFVQGAAEDLSRFEDQAFDLIFAAYLFPYVAALPATLNECQRVLRAGGRLVISQDHPLRACFYDPNEDEYTLYPNRSYFADEPQRWRHPGRSVWLETYHYTITHWVDALNAAGLTLQRIVEPQTSGAWAERLWAEDSPLFSIRNLPHTMIVLARKNPGVTSGAIRCG